VEKLRTFKEGTVSDRIMTVIDEAGIRAMGLPGIASRRGLSLVHLREHIRALVRAGRIRELTENPCVVVSENAFNRSADAVSIEVKRFHETSPLVQGISREELKARLFADASSLVFQAVLDKLVADGKIAVAQDVIHVFGRKVTLKADEERMRAQLVERFEGLGLQVARADDVIDTLKLDRNTARKIIRLLLKENVLVKISEEMLVAAAAIDKLIADVKALKSRNPRFGIGEFKSLTGVTRKHAIPLLEYLDRQRVTRRVGDERTIL
jgi:selenocysteine-specific elongation factor